MKFLLMNVLVMFSLAAGAQNGAFNRVSLEFNGKIFKKNSTIQLKTRLKKKFPNANLKNWELQSVVLFSKSKNGGGEASLLVGNRQSRVKAVDRSAGAFRRNQNYHRLIFRAPSTNNRDARWQIKMQGLINVDRVVVVARRDPRNRPNPRPGRGQVTRNCSYQLEFVIGHDIRRYSATARGQRGTGINARACAKARKQCESAMDHIPLTRCVQVSN